MPAEAPANLSRREREVYALTVAGLSARQIAAQLGRAVRTISTYRWSIRHKSRQPVLDESSKALYVCEVWRVDPDNLERDLIGARSVEKRVTGVYRRPDGFLNLLVEEPVI